jgi:hypothetical protein
LLAALLAEHVNVVRLRIDEQGTQTDEEVSPPASFRRCPIELAVRTRGVMALLSLDCLYTRSQGGDLVAELLELFRQIGLAWFVYRFRAIPNEAVETGDNPEMTEPEICAWIVDNWRT